jgi:hypothetical protein
MSDASTDIRGDYHVEGFADWSGDTAPVPKFCEKCGHKFPWADKLNDDPVTKLDPAASIARICERISLVIRQLRDRHNSRGPHDVTDEYDLQDLLHALLHLFFDDVRPEEYTPSYAGKAARNNLPAANTWEFHVMLKWNLPSPLIWGRVLPFLEGGPAFRTSQDDEGALPSQFGLTAGVGAAIHFGKLRVAPTIRYTRWDKDANFPNYPTKADQLEFLTSVAWGTSSDPVHATGHRLSLGVMGEYLYSVIFTTLPAESGNASAIWPGLRGNWNYAKAWRWRSMPSTSRCTPASARGKGLRC